MKPIIASVLFVCLAGGPLYAATVSPVAPPPAGVARPSALPTADRERELHRAQRAANADMELNVSAAPSTTPRRKITASAGSSSPKALIVYSNAPDAKAHEET